MENKKVVVDGITISELDKDILLIEGAKNRMIYDKSYLPELITALQSFLPGTEEKKFPQEVTYKGKMYEYVKYDKPQEGETFLAQNDFKDICLDTVRDGNEVNQMFCNGNRAIYKLKEEVQPSPSRKQTRTIIQYEVVGERVPKKGDIFINYCGLPEQAPLNFINSFPILSRLPDLVEEVEWKPKINERVWVIELHSENPIIERTHYGNYSEILYKNGLVFPLNSRPLAEQKLKELMEVLRG